MTAPYLHDGGVAASSKALQLAATGAYQIGQADQIGMAGTLMQRISPDAAASLQMLVDLNLRKPMIEANRANADLARSNIDGSGHHYWIDRNSGFTLEEQTAAIEFLLSLDDDPKVLPNK